MSGEGVILIPYGMLYSTSRATACFQLFRFAVHVSYFHRLKKKRDQDLNSARNQRSEQLLSPASPPTRDIAPDSLRSLKFVEGTPSSIKSKRFFPRPEHFFSSIKPIPLSENQFAKFLFRSHSFFAVVQKSCFEQLADLLIFVIHL